MPDQIPTQLPLSNAVPVAQPTPAPAPAVRPQPPPAPEPSETHRIIPKPKPAPPPEPIPEPTDAEKTAAAEKEAAWHKILVRDFPDMVAKAQKKEDKPAAPAPTPAPAPTGTPPEPVKEPESPKKTADEPDKPAKVVRRTSENLEQVVKETIERAMAKLPLPEKPTAKPAEEPPKPVEEDLTGWEPEEIEALEIAKFAEQAVPDRYKGQAAKVKAFRMEVNEYFAKAKKENPERTLDANDTELAEWIEEHKPKYLPGDESKLRRQIIEVAAVKKVREELQPELAKQQEKIKELEFQPVIEKQIKMTEQQVSKLVEGDEFLKENLNVATLAENLARAKEEGIEKVLPDLPIEDRVAVAEFHATGQLAKELLSLEYRTKELNPQDPAHQWLWRFRQKQDAVIRNQPKESQMRDGRQFVTREEYARILQDNPADAERVWTWSTSDLVSMLLINARATVANKLKMGQEMLKKSGWERKPKAAPKADNPKPPNETPPEPVTKSPKATATPAPGAAVTNSKPIGNPPMSESMLRIRGYR